LVEVWRESQRLWRLRTKGWKSSWLKHIGILVGEHDHFEMTSLVMNSTMGNMLRWGAIGISGGFSELWGQKNFLHPVTPSQSRLHHQVEYVISSILIGGRGELV